MADDKDSMEYLDAFRGYFRSALRWEELDRLWETLRSSGGEWYVYAVGEPPPRSPVSSTQLNHFIVEIDRLLHQEHDEDYCGIVYADDPAAPSMVKIYDPNNLGSVCGPGFGPPPLPGWVLSRLEPVDLPAAMPQPGNRRRWWQRLFG